MKNNVHIATYQAEAKALANELPAFAENVIVRLGGTKRYKDYPVQINTVRAVENSINKLTQKQLLIDGNVNTLPLLKDPKYPCVVKGIIRSCGTSVFVVNNKREYDGAVSDLGKKENYKGHIIEPLFVATGEYRLHCTREKVFFSVKKHKRNPQDVIINHKNHYNTKDFVKPRLWDEIQAECVKAMKVLDLDIACFDVMYNSADNYKHVFYIAEANTNPEMLANTFNAYKDTLTELIKAKIAALPKQNEKKEEIKPKKEQILKGGLTPEQTIKVINGILNNEYWITENGELLNIKI